MKGNRLVIKDYATFSYMDESVLKINDFLTNADNVNKQVPGLQVTIAATHAGLLTRNNTLYLPKKMKDSVHTFIEPYPKPVLLHHNQEGDAIGRIKQARYVDTSSHILDQFGGLEVKNEVGRIVGTINDSLIRDFCDGRMPHGMQVDVVRNILRDGAVLEDIHYAGLGFAEIIANITDKDAIEKFRDGRYLTGSVGASTDSATCSECKQNWITDGKCEHRPGKIYDKRKMFLIAGKFEYGEYSVANSPADRQSQVLELHYNGIQDSVEIHDPDKQRIYEISPQFHLLSDSVSEEENFMADKKTSNKDASNVQDDDKNKPAEEETIEDFLSRVLEDDETVLSDSDQEKAYSLLLDELKEIGLSEEEITDAKLSTESRSKLPSSKFCGPNRSFPVTDCAHVTAARRLVGRAKISDAAKTKVLACVDRKAKTLECSEGKETKDSTNKQEDVEDKLSHSRVMRQVLNLLEEDQYFNQEPVLDDTEMKMLSGILKRLSTLVTKDNFIKAAKEEEILTDSEQELTNEVKTLKSQVEDLTKEKEELVSIRDALRQEYRDISNDFDTVLDKLTDEKKKNRNSKISHLVLLQTLKDKEQKEEFSEAAMKLTDEALDNELQRVGETVDIQAITDKLGDGMSRTPEGSVDDPTVIADTTDDDSITDKSGSTKKFTDEEVKKELADIQEKYLGFVFRNSHQAKIWKEEELKRLEREGKIRR